jgi:asparagine synthase (glutamine-hydrolysing)
MCGFSGVLGLEWASCEDAIRSTLAQMTDRLAHRGPDAEGQWFDPAAGIALGHRRLAIVELSDAGSQPMHSAGGRYVLSYNGEIYNHSDLRRQLASDGRRPDWRGHSDTETLLACIDAWGVDRSLAKAIGMFAFAVWDREARVLTLARDRLGEKPLYYGWCGSGNARAFLFGSQISSLRPHPCFDTAIDRGSLSLLMRHSYIPAPYSIYRSIRKLPPGCIATLSLQQREPRIRSYWSGTETARNGLANRFFGDPDAAVDALEGLLRDAVGRQMIADVPLGACLSGGVDSSAVVALMQAQSARPINTFSIGFHEKDFNEADHAKAVAHHLGTDHVELYVTADDAMAVVPALSTIYDEPFADSSQIPTYLVSRLARRHVTVALSGDGGDELFGGYTRYHLTHSMWRHLSRIPRFARLGAAKAIKSISSERWGAVGAAASSLLPGDSRLAQLGEKMHRGADVIGSLTVGELYHGVVSSWRTPDELVVGGKEPPTSLCGDEPDLHGLSDVERMMVLDLITYLPGDILAKVDRASMAVSLESRVPMLDHRVVEFAAALPMAYKWREGQSKWVLRQVLYRHVPRKLIERRKMGFGVPVGSWLRGPLRNWAAELVDARRVRQEGYLNSDMVSRAWWMHQRGTANLESYLWPVLMFQQWLESTGRGAR